MSSPSVLVVAGEASGDAHAAAVVRALRRLRPEARVFGIGGRALREAGLEVLFDARELAVVGVAEVLPRLPRIWKILRRLVLAARQRRPAAAILVDAPDFNLRVAARLARQGVPVLYYIAPQAWAWRRGRVRLLRRVVRRLAVVFPFELPFFGEAGIDTAFVGHPLVDGIAWPSRAEARAALSVGEGPVVAVLPGSRPSEVRRHLAPMVAGARAHVGPTGTLLCPVASTLDARHLAEALPPGAPDLRLVEGDSRWVLAAADRAVVASGTATLEAALAGTPAVVGYRLHPLTYVLARMLVRTPFIAMPNLLAGRAILPELVQGRLTAQGVARALDDVAAREDEIRAALREVRASLGGAGAAERVAALAAELIDDPATRA